MIWLVSLSTDLSFASLVSFTLAHHGLGLGTHDTTTPDLGDFFVLVVVVGLDGLDEGSEVLLVFGGNVTESDSGGGLLVDEGTETRLALDDAIGDTHFTAESGQPDNQFNRVNVVGNDNELSLLGFNESGDVVQAVLDADGLFTLFNGLTGSLGSSSGSQTSLLFNAALRLVLVEETEKLGGSVLVQSAGELVDGRGNLQTTLQNRTLTLQTNIFGPLDITSQITSLGQNVLTDRVDTVGLFK